MTTTAVATLCAPSSRSIFSMSRWSWGFRGFSRMRPLALIMMVSAAMTRAGSPLSSLLTSRE